MRVCVYVQDVMQSVADWLAILMDNYKVSDSSCLQPKGFTSHCKDHHTVNALIITYICTIFVHTPTHYCTCTHAVEHVYTLHLYINNTMPTHYICACILYLLIMMLPCRFSCTMDSWTSLWVSH